MTATYMFFARQVSSKDIEECWLADPELHILDEEGVARPARQIAAWRDKLEWAWPVKRVCATEFCLNPDHWEVIEIEETPEAEQLRLIDRDLRLVERHSISLAELYRKGRQAGLLSATTAYK